MQYRAISADGHVNEPPTLWTERLPDKFKERGPHVIETRKTKGHAWIMEGQKRPSPMGFSSMYFRSGKRFDRASLIDSFKQIKDRGVRYEDVFPGSYDPAARVNEIIEDETDAEVIFNGVGTVWNGIKLCPDKELSLACFKVYNDWIAEFQAYAPERFICNATLPTTGLGDCLDELERIAGLGLRTAQLESYPSGSFFEPTPEDDRFWAAAVEMDMPINVHTQFFFPAGDLGSKISAEGRGPTARAGQEPRTRRRGGQLPGHLGQDDHLGGLRALSRPQVRRLRGPHGLGALLPRALRRVGPAQPGRLDPPAVAERVLPAERERRLYRRRDGRGQPLRHRSGQHHVGPGLPALVERAGPSTISSASRSSNAPAPRRARSSGSCGGTRPTPTRCPTTNPPPSEKRHRHRDASTGDR